MKKPIKATAHQATVVGSPQSSITPGIWVLIKATWNPQVKNPRINKLKLVVREAKFSVSRRVKLLSLLLCDIELSTFKAQQKGIVKMKPAIRK